LDEDCLVEQSRILAVAYGCFEVVQDTSELELDDLRRRDGGRHFSTLLYVKKDTGFDCITIIQ
jgi:hypothetical protein